MRRPLQRNDSRTKSGSRHEDRWRSALSIARTLDSLGFGNLCKNGRCSRGHDLFFFTRPHTMEGRLQQNPKRYGREATPATAGRQHSRSPHGLRRILRKATDRSDSPSERGIDACRRYWQTIDSKRPNDPSRHDLRFINRGDQLLVSQDFSAVRPTAFRGQSRGLLLAPPERRELPTVCRDCPELTA